MNPDRHSLPVGRRDNLLVEHLPDEVVVYDLRSHQVHCLNATAARVWELCDGKHTREQLGEALQHEFGLPSDHSVVDLALANLSRASLLEAGSAATAGIPVTRRAVMSRLVLAASIAAVLPAIRSVPAQAQGFIGSCAPAPNCLGRANCGPCYIPHPAPEDALENQCEKRVCWQGLCVRRVHTTCP